MDAQDKNRHPSIWYILIDSYIDQVSICEPCELKLSIRVSSDCDDTDYFSRRIKNKKGIYNEESSLNSSENTRGGGR